MSGLGCTMNRDLEPVVAPIETTHVATRSESAQGDGQRLRQQYERDLALWSEKQARGCMAIRNRCGYNEYKKVHDKTRVYDMLDTLKTGRTGGAGRLIDLTTKFYAVTLAECKDVTELSATLSKINNELQELHASAAFSTVQLVLRFLQALGSAYEIFTTTFQQTHNLIESPDHLAVTFDIAIQKAFDEEQRQNSSTNGAALLAHSRTSTGDVCTFCKKPYHTEATCFRKYPHLKKEYDENRKKRDRKRRAKSDGGGDTKRVKETGTETDSSLDVSTPSVNFNCLALDEPTVRFTDRTDGTTNTAFSTAGMALKDDWIVDTGCTNHATGTLSYFKDIVYGDFGTCSGVGGPVRYEGKGTVQIPIPGPKNCPATLTLTDVKYCPSMGPFNLISVSQLYRTKKARPIMTEKHISWVINGHTIKSSAKHGLWLLDRPK